MFIHCSYQNGTLKIIAELAETLSISILLQKMPYFILNLLLESTHNNMNFTKIKLAEKYICFTVLDLECVPLA
jgi:hypothetical protein